MSNFLIARRAVSIIICTTLFAGFSFSSVSAQIDEPFEIDTVTAFIPRPPEDVTAKDFKYDTGEAVELEWLASPDDIPERGKVTDYIIYKSLEESPTYDSLAAVMVKGPEDTTATYTYKDETVEAGATYTYRITAISRTGESIPAESNAVTPDTEWINWNLSNLFIIGLLISGSVIFFITKARQGQKLFIRKIAGLEAVDEAIGRATEMGRPILFIPGINDMDDVQTIAGITILSRVAKVVADYDIQINMPVSRSMVMTTARETIKEAYIGAGRPDAYNDDMVRYVTDEQFGYVAAVDGIMVREKPATCFFLGAFFAESLILAETGNSIGAIQIAGTAMPAQLPFFVAACDYTLIGEELFAASAYLSHEPKQLGSIKGQDVAKFIAMIAIGIGVLSATMVQLSDIGLFEGLSRIMGKLFTVIN